jgi:hypothetical protein
MAQEVFVFGSNLAGRHGRGAALEARQNWGARYGQGVGMQGNSYAIPTKDRDLRPLPLAAIEEEVKIFLRIAELMGYAHRYLGTRIGCGLAGYTDAQIAPMFRGAPPNVVLPPEWKEFL